MSESDELRQGLARTIEDFAKEHKTWGRGLARSDSVDVGEKLSALGFSASIVVPERTPAKEHIRLLNLAATQLRKTDIGTAIQYLRRARALAEAIDDWSNTTEWYLRLPLFLQQAGRIDEAIKEFDVLLSNWEKFNQVISPQANELMREHAREVYLATIYDKLRLAWQREKNTTRAQEAAKACAVHRAEQDRLWPLIEAERKAEMDEYKRKRADLKGGC